MLFLAKVELSNKGRIPAILGLMKIQEEN